MNTFGLGTAENPYSTIHRLEKELHHWKANHADMVLRCSILRGRPDLPVDRLPAMKRAVDALTTERLRADALERELEDARLRVAGMKDALVWVRNVILNAAPGTEAVDAIDKAIKAFEEKK